MKPQIIVFVTLLTSLFGCASTPSQAPIVMNNANDGSLSCSEIVGEINQMNTILGIAQGEVRSAQTLGMATSVAVSAVVHSGALTSVASSVPFLGQVASVAGQLNRMNEKQAQEQAQQASDRRNVLTGIYAGKGCSSGNT